MTFLIFQTNASLQSALLLMQQIKPRIHLKFKRNAINNYNLEIEFNHKSHGWDTSIYNTPIDLSLLSE